jgi:hypothetical protein
MRLLNAVTNEIVEFIADDDIPPYAILSHTWGKEEVTFQDMCPLPGLPKIDMTWKPGYVKIKHCCRQARQDGLEWIWIDS